MGAIQPEKLLAWSSIPYIALFVTSVLFLSMTRIRYRRGLRQVPGPFLASISPVDRILTTAYGHQFLDHIRYHEKYGSMVRVGPNHVSLSNAEHIPTIYGIATKYYKSDFYSMFDVKTKTGLVVPTIFSIRNEEYHKVLKRPVAHAYSTSTLKDFESLVDDCTEIFEDKLGKMEGTSFDFGKWLHWFAFDVISSITFSDRLGFMEKEEDVGGIIDAIEGRLAYNSVIGEIPGAHQYLLGSSIFAFFANRFSVFKRLGSAAYIVQFSAKQLARYQEKQNLSEDTKMDMLSRFKMSKDGDRLISDGEMLSHAASNIFAGSDTTAIALRSIFYHLCKVPSAYKSAIKEIDSSNLSDPVTFAEGQRLTYVQACIKEGLRIQPAVGMLLERIVPEGGATFDGVFFPAGTIIGMNPWVVARDKSAYGDDAADFRPERWLEASPAQLKLMERNFLAFGAGARTCLGKNISLFEITKLVPQILKNWRIELSDPKAELTYTDHWFVKQEGLVCKLSRRGQSS